MDKRRDRAIGSLVGLAIGDAVGTTLEFRSRQDENPLSDMVGGGPFRLKPGEWTDDTSMALCLADSLLENHGKVVPRDLLSRWVNWWRWGHNSVTGECFDIGNATANALATFEMTGSTVNNDAEHLQANGSIMRLAPVVICSTSAGMAVTLALQQGKTTHAARVPQDCCAKLATLLFDAIESGRIPASVLTYGRTSRDEVVSSGHAPATLSAAQWAMATTDSFEGAILAAANLGGDADTVAAVTGQLAGAVYGMAAIPATWLQKLSGRDEIIERASHLWDLRQAVISD